MKINVELDQFLVMLADIASDAKDEARIRFAGTKADAVTMGIAILHQNIRTSLSDAADFDLATETDAEVLGEAISLYCRERCDCSREQEPGTHDLCPTCPLMPFMVGALENAVEQALKDDDG